MNLKDGYLHGLTAIPVQTDETPREGDVLTVYKDSEGVYSAKWASIPTIAQEVGTGETNVFMWDSEQEAWYIGVLGYTDEELATIEFGFLEPMIGGEGIGHWYFATGELVDAPSYLQQSESYTVWELLASGFNVEGGSIVLDGTALFDTLTLTPQASAPTGMGKGTIYYDSDDDSVYVQTTD